MEADFTGGHLLHLAAAGCVLNDLYREAAALGIELKGARVIASGGFDTATWRSTGIDYSVQVSSDAPTDQLAHLLEVLTKWLRFPGPSEPELLSGGSTEQVPHPQSSRPAPVDAHLAAEAGIRAHRGAA